MVTHPGPDPALPCEVWQPLLGHNGAAAKVLAPPSCNDKGQPPCTTCPTGDGGQACEWWYLGKAKTLEGCEALQVHGLLGDQVCQTVTWCGAGGPGDVFADACFCGSGTEWIAPAWPQANINSAVCLRFGTPASGATFLILLALAATVYVGGGLLLARQRGSSPQLGLRAHPHAHLWLELAALCREGAVFVSNSGRPPQRRGGGGERLLGGGEQSTGDRDSNPSRKSKGSSKGSSKRGSKSGTKSSKGKVSSQQQVTPPTAATAPAVGSAAGGGGRWIHVEGS